MLLNFDERCSMYTFGSRIRYSETDEYGKLTLTGIMNYLQDCSTFQSEDIGLGISYLTEHHLEGKDVFHSMSSSDLKQV